MQGQVSNSINRLATLGGACAAPTADNIDSILNSIAITCSDLVGLNERVADNLTGGSPQVSPKIESADGSVMSRLRVIQGMLNSATSDANRARIALGLS